MNTDLTDCLTIVASHFGRVVSTGIPSGDSKKYCFSFADSKFQNYICSVEYLDNKINVFFFLDVVVLHGIDGSKKDVKNALMMEKKLYRVGGELMAAGHSVKYV